MLSTMQCQSPCIEPNANLLIDISKGMVFISRLALQATRAYLHAEADVEKALQKAGFRVKRRDLTATSFYFSLLMEAERC